MTFSRSFCAKSAFSQSAVQPERLSAVAMRLVWSRVLQKTIALSGSSALMTWTSSVGLGSAAAIDEMLNGQRAHVVAAERDEEGIFQPGLGDTLDVGGQRGAEKERLPLSWQLLQDGE